MSYSVPFLDLSGVVLLPMTSHDYLYVNITMVSTRALSASFFVPFFRSFLGFVIAYDFSDSIHICFP